MTSGDINSSETPPPATLAAANSSSPASNWRKFAALCVDLAALSILQPVVGLFVGLILFIGMLIMGGTKWHPTDIFVAYLLLFFIVVAVFVNFVLYPAIFESSKLQATPGKMLLGLRVQSLSGERLTLLRCLLNQIIQLTLFGLNIAGFIGVYALVTSSNPHLSDDQTTLLVLFSQAGIIILPLLAYAIRLPKSGGLTAIDKLLRQAVVHKI